MKTKHRMLASALFISSFAIAQHCCMGGYCGTGPTPLTTDYEVPLNSNNFYFSGDKAYTEKVHVGHNCGVPGLGKFNATTQLLSTASTQWGFPQSIAVSAISSDPTTTGGMFNIGTRTEGSTNSWGGFPIGLYSTANGPGHAYGILSELGGNAVSNGIHAGVRSLVRRDNNDRNIGVWSHAIGANLTPGGMQRFNIGISGYACDQIAPGIEPWYFQPFNNQTNIGIYGCAGNYIAPYVTPSNNYAAWFDGDVMVNGTGYNSVFAVFTSDRKFKDNITTIENASSILNRLNPTTYFMKTKNEYGIAFSDKKQYGFISQEVEEILPDLVTNVHKPNVIDKDGKELHAAVDYKGLSYISFIAILTKGFQEQQEVIDSQNEKIDALEKAYKEVLKATTSGISPARDINNQFHMEQNTPNPFTHETTIGYALPKEVRNASLIVYDLTGKQLSSFNLDQKSTSLIITSEKLAAGIYIYSIMADGKIMDSKRMVVAEK